MGLIKAAFGAAGGVLADQWKEFFYYAAAREVLKDCTVTLYQQLSGDSIRYAAGLQAVLFRAPSGAALLVCHSFAHCANEVLSLPLPDLGCPAARTFGPAHCCIIGADGLTIRGMEEYSGFSMLWSAN